MIISARQRQERCIEQNLDQYQCFIDIAKTFDTVNREALWKVLGKLGCPPYFIALIRFLHDDVNALVTYNSTLAESVPVRNGVKQDCFLFPQLFGIFIAVVFKIALKTNIHGNYIR